MRTSSALSPNLQALQQRLQHEFSSPRLLVQALTHRSFSSDHNERIEFLGDSVLNLAVAGLLYEQLGELPEGDLSRVRANLVKQDTLHKVAVTLGLPDLLRLGEGEAKSGGQKRPSILADAIIAEGLSCHRNVRHAVQTTGRTVLQKNHCATLGLHPYGCRRETLTSTRPPIVPE